MASDQLLVILAALPGLIVVCAATLKGWQDWLDFRSRELEHTPRLHHRGEIEGGALAGAARIELADLRERLRKLEAIAAGVDL